MIKANFNAYNTYITDSLYQWDINQDLTISGLNLSVVPEVHFSNRNTDRAIVRQSTMTNHIVKVRIPNSLLQEPFTIYAHIGIYEGDTFKVVEKVEIPVSPKARPSDYQIQDTDEEIYSFKALENKVVNVATIQMLTETNNKLSALERQTTSENCNGCVVFNSGTDYAASSMVPLINADRYHLSINNAKIMGTNTAVDVTQIKIGLCGTGFYLYTTDSNTIKTVGGKAISFDFILQN